MDLPAIAYALPLSSEPRWSDMLAVLVATDPDPLDAVLGGVLGESRGLSVRREVAVDPLSQPDIVIERRGQRLAVIEVKVLAGLGSAQLVRYAAAVPDASAYALIHPERLVIDLGTGSSWRALTWESVLDAYRRSNNAWVATCANAWLAHLRRSLPAVNAATVWNHLADGEDFVVALRARMSWLHGHLAPPQPNRTRLGVISGRG